MALLIEATLKTPKIIVNSEEGEIIVAGISIPEDPYEFYHPLHKEIDNYLINPAGNTTLSFQLEYFNSGTTIIVRNIIKKLSTIVDFKVNWLYEENDEEMKESGDEFKLLFGKTFFNNVPLKEYRDF